LHFLATHHVAAAVGLHEDVIAEQVEEGKFPAPVVEHRGVLYWDRTAVADWIAANRLPGILASSACGEEEE
jgi:hypothetical protein